MTTEITREVTQKIAAAYKAGRCAAREYNGLIVSIQVRNPHSNFGCIPESCSMQLVLWHAFDAGVLRETPVLASLGYTPISQAATGLRNARYIARRVIELGRA